MLSIKKYANGGTNANGEKLAQIFSTAASKLGIEPEALVQKAQELQGNAQVGFVQALQDIAENDNPNPQSVQIVQNLFSKSQAFKKGGKIEQFVCKHAKGGKANCGCMDDGGKVEKAQRGGLSGKWYNENGVELPDNWQGRDGRYGYIVSPTREGETAAYFNDLNSKAAYWQIPAYPIQQNISKFRITANEDYPNGVLAMANFEPNEQAEAIAKIARWQPQDKAWNGVERQQAGGQIINGPAISREEALNVAANSLYNGNRSIARTAYQNAKNALRNRGLRGNNLRNEARAMIMGLNNLPIIDDNVPENIISSNDLGVKYEVTPSGNVPIFKDLDSSVTILPVKQVPVYNLSNYSDEELANRVIAGEYGNGAARRNALGDRYSSVQRIVDSRLKRIPIRTITDDVNNSNITNQTASEKENIFDKIAIGVGNLVGGKFGKWLGSKVF